jgi:hypothetical protein
LIFAQVMAAITVHILGLSSSRIRPRLRKRQSDFLAVGDLQVVAIWIRNKGSVAHRIPQIVRPDPQSSFSRGLGTEPVHLCTALTAHANMTEGTQRRVTLPPEGSKEVLPEFSEHDHERPCMVS